MERDDEIVVSGPEPIEDSEAKKITGGGCNPNDLCNSCGDSLFVCLMNGNCSD